MNVVSAKCNEQSVHDDGEVLNTCVRACMYARAMGLHHLGNDCSRHDLVPM